MQTCSAHLSVCFRIIRAAAAAAGRGRGRGRRRAVCNPALTRPEAPGPCARNPKRYTAQPASFLPTVGLFNPYIRPPLPLNRSLSRNAQRAGCALRWRALSHSRTRGVSRLDAGRVRAGRVRACKLNDIPPRPAGSTALARGEQARSAARPAPRVLGAEDCSPRGALPPCPPARMQAPRLIPRILTRTPYRHGRLTLACFFSTLALCASLRRALRLTTFFVFSSFQG